MQARKHDLAHHNGDVDRYENFGRNTRTATAVAKHAHAQNNGHNRANARKSDLNYGDNEGRRVDRRSGITSKRRQVEAQNRRYRNRDHRERDKRNRIYLKQQREFLFWRRRKRIRCGHIPWALPSLLSMHNNAPIITMHSAIKARKQPFFAQKPSCPGEERATRTRNRESKMHRNLHGSSAMPRNALHQFGYGIVMHRQVGYVTVTFLR